VFDAYQVPYRIGISSFGRIARRRSNSTGKSTVQYYRDVTPLDFTRQEFSRSTSVTAAGELVVRYDVVTPPPDRRGLAAGDIVEITFPTEESVRAAYDAVRQFGGYCAGAVFFRWPNRSETLAFSPDDVRRVVSSEAVSKDAKLEVRSASCIERQCSD